MTSTSKHVPSSSTANHANSVYCAARKLVRKSLSRNKKTGKLGSSLMTATNSSISSSVISGGNQNSWGDASINNGLMNSFGTIHHQKINNNLVLSYNMAPPTSEKENVGWIFVFRGALVPLLLLTKRHAWTKAMKRMA